MRFRHLVLTVAIVVLGAGSCKDKENDNSKEGLVECLTKDASSISTMRADLNGKVVLNGVSASDVYLFFYYSDKISDAVDLRNKGNRVVSESSLGEDGSFHVTINGLTPQTKYNFIAAVATKSGEEVTGEVKSFITVESPVKTNDASGIAELKATLNGSVSGDLAKRSNLKAWFLWSNTEDTLEWLKYKGNKVEATMNSNGTFSYELQSLTQGTRYHFVSLVRDGDVEYYGDVKSFSTLDINAKVSTEDALDVKIVEATLNGRLRLNSHDALKASVHFLYSGSRMNLEELKASGTKVDSEADDNGAFTSNITGLLPLSTYYYVAFAVVSGQSFFGNVRSFTTSDYSAEPVDLGLPSGLLWSAYNLGATAEEEYGAYYAWGELEPKADNMYNYANYKWCEGSDETFTKYCTNEAWGSVDNLLELEPEDDVAAVKLGGGWRMPTKAEQDELRTYCSWKWVSKNGVAGCEITSLENGNTLFFPAAGAKVGFGGPGSTFSIWSKTLSIGHSRFAPVICGDYMSFNEGSAYRMHGHCVRPVIEGPPQEEE